MATNLLSPASTPRGCCLHPLTPSHRCRYRHMVKMEASQSSSFFSDEVRLSTLLLYCAPVSLLLPSMSEMVGHLSFKRAALTFFLLSGDEGALPLALRAICRPARIARRGVCTSTFASACHVRLLCAHGKTCSIYCCDVALLCCYMFSWVCVVGCMLNCL